MKELSIKTDIKITITWNYNITIQQNYSASSNKIFKSKNYYEIKMWKIK